MSTDEPIGYIVNVSSLNIATIALKNLDVVGRYDYVYFNLNEKIDNEWKVIKVLGQIIEIKREPYRLNSESYIADIFSSMPKESLVEVITGRMVILGFKHNGTIRTPKSTPQIGTPVYLASDDLVREIIHVNKDRTLCIGHLIAKPSVEACIDVNGLRRHLAIIAATGSGKTWSSVILIEELLKKGATLVVIDPHGEYVPVGSSLYRLGPEYANRVVVVKVSPHHFGDVKYRVNIAKIDSETLSSIAGIPKGASRIRYLVHLIHILVKKIVEVTGNRKVCTLRNMIKIVNMLLRYGQLKSINQVVKILNPELNDKNLVINDKEKINEIIQEINEVVSDRKAKNILISTRIYLRKLSKLGVYTYYSTSLKKILKPAHVAIINLAGVSDEVQDHVTYHILSRIFKARINYVRKLRGFKYKYPVIVIIEEAHKLAPPRSKRKTWSLEIISRIASEGRKFGTYLVVITQRPSKIDQDILSQCNSQIILRIINSKDRDAVISSSEVLSDEYAKIIPILNVGEALITGPVTPIPILVKLRDRVLSYGGGDIDLVKTWLRARKVIKMISNAEMLTLMRELLGIDIDDDYVEKSLELLDKVKDVEYDFGVLRGIVGNSRVEVRIREKSWHCSTCDLRICKHVIALIYKAIIDGVISAKKYLDSKETTT